MTDGPDVPGEWDPSGQAEPPAALLRRAISHVEQLLQRLERPGAPVEGAESAATTGISSESLGTTGVTIEGGPLRDDTGAIEPVLNNPVRRISSAAQAEALRVSLNAHEKANRLLAEASAIRAQSASEGEQILVEARELADRMQSEAGEEAALYVQRAREEAENLVNQAAAEMQRVRNAATDEADRIRSDAAAEVQNALQTAQAEALLARDSAQHESEQLRREAQEEADQLRTSARDESDRMRADAEHLRDSVQQEADRLLTASSEEAQRLREDAEREAQRIRSDAENQARVDREAADDAIREVLDKATADAEQIRVQAREQGQAEGAQLVEARVQEAVAQARTELDAEKSRVYQLLGSANESVAEVRMSMRDLVEALGRSMGAVNGATGSIDALMGRLRDAAHDHGVEIPGPPDAAEGVDAPDGAPPAGPDDTGPVETVRDEASADATAAQDQAGDEMGDAGGSGETDPGAENSDPSYRGDVEDSDPDDPAEGEEGGDDARRPLGLLFGASHKSRASKR